MGCLGVHFALDAADEARLLALPNDDARLEFVTEELEEGWDEDWLQQTDKAWDAIHRSLTDGTMSWDTDEDPLYCCILGGQRLYVGNDYIITYKSRDQVREIASALEMIDKAALRIGYNRIDPGDYGLPLSEDDFEYTWHWFEGVKEFFRKAADAGRAVIFSADQ